MSHEFIMLAVTAASIGFLHTIMGPDHYLPFIAISKARDWSLKKTSFITCLCGLGHVISSILLGFVGIAFGIAVGKLEFIESFRGDIAAWFLICFGLVYFIWGIRRAFKHKVDEKEIYKNKKNNNKSLTPWMLFIIFAFGPCEPLIPILMYPAYKQNLFGVFFVSFIFGVVTILTMLSIVLVVTFNLKFVPLKHLERFAHPLAGAMILFCGIGIKFLGF